MNQELNPNVKWLKGGEMETDAVGIADGLDREETDEPRSDDRGPWTV